MSTLASSQSSRPAQIDRPLLLIYFLIVTIGWLMIYAVGYLGEDQFKLSDNAAKQLMFIGIAMFLLLIILVMDANFWRTFSFPIYGFSLILLLGVVFLGVKIKGATAWYSFGGFSFQPVEIAKFGTCLAIANFLSSFNANIKSKKSLFVVIGLIAVPQAIIMLQPDAGSALVFCSFFILLYREGLANWIYVLALSLISLFVCALLFETFNVILFLVLTGIIILVFNFQWKLYAQVLTGLGIIAANYFAIEYGFQDYTLISDVVLLLILAMVIWLKGKSQQTVLLLTIIGLCSLITYGANFVFSNFLQPHQQERINVWLHPERCDPRGSLYNVLQSKMAIGSGGLTGKGFLNGTLTKLNYVPEQSTDFIFCTVGEELGFVGATIVLSLYVILILRILYIAERQRLVFARLYAYGVAGILLFHFVINIGMTLGLLPIIGIPLPLMSYGGSSLLGFTLLLGVLIKLDRTRK